MRPCHPLPSDRKYFATSGLALMLMGILVGDFCGPLSPTLFFILANNAGFASDNGLNFLSSSAVNRESKVEPPDISDENSQNLRPSHASP